MRKEYIDENYARYEKRYQDLGKRLADSIWVVDADTLKVLFVSRPGQNLCGYGMDGIIGRYLKEISTEDSYQMALIELMRARRDYERGKDPAARLELECYNKHNTTTWVEIVAKFVQEVDEPLQIVGVSRNISDRKFDEMNRSHLLKMYMETLTEERRLLSDIKLFENLLPICSGCRQIRDDEGRWWNIETYVREKTDGRSAGTLCPKCKTVLNAGK